MSETGGRPPPAAPPHPPQQAQVDAIDEQSAVEIDVEHLTSLARRVLREEGHAGGSELSLRFVDEDTMTQLNRQHMGGDGPTDVLAFPLDGLDAPGATSAGRALGMPVLLGDVVVCPVVARRNAGARGGCTDDELALLMVHGILHVLGMDHAEPDEAAAMQARERAHLAVTEEPGG